MTVTGNDVGVMHVRPGPITGYGSVNFLIHQIE
jgi:hypothetical protein